MVQLRVLCAVGEVMGKILNLGHVGRSSFVIGGQVQVVVLY